MTLNYAQETYFNTAVYNSLLSFGVTTADGAAAGTALTYFNRYGGGISGNKFIDGSKLTQICNTSTCPDAPNAYYFAYGVITSSTGPYISSSSSSTGNGVSSTASVSVAMLFAALVAVVSMVL